MYIHERENWTDFIWDASKLTALLEKRQSQARITVWQTCDTAIRDIQDLVAKNILCEDFHGVKRPSYSIVYNNDDIALLF